MVRCHNSGKLSQSIEISELVCVTSFIEIGRYSQSVLSVFSSQSPNAIFVNFCNYGLDYEQGVVVFESIQGKTLSQLFSIY